MSLVFWRTGSRTTAKNEQYRLALQITSAATSIQQISLKVTGAITEPVPSLCSISLGSAAEFETQLVIIRKRSFLKSK
ncbi:four helix bundle protein [Candidatus Saccharibacteria bacterium]|nr:MAG: four helix bundle protein [Candidatus Saccharibacteria bacterium]